VLHIYIYDISNLRVNITKDGILQVTASKSRIGRWATNLHPNTFK